jgi:hypothetical protein
MLPLQRKALAKIHSQPDFRESFQAAIRMVVLTTAYHVAHSVSTGQPNIVTKRALSAVLSSRGSGQQFGAVKTGIQD